MLLIRHRVEPISGSFEAILPFTIYGIIIPTLLSSTIIAINLWIDEYIVAEAIYSYILLLIFAHGLGLFLIYPIYQNPSRPPPEHKELKEAVFYGLASFILIYLSFTFHFLNFIFAALIIILAFRINEDVVSVILIFSITELIAFSARLDPIFVSGSSNDYFLMLMSFIGSLSFLVFGITQHRKDLLQHKFLSSTDF